MAPKKQTPAPIDRPLSRAYLREFKGWSTAYPPGVSDPTTLRLMENMQINRNGSCRIRPGLRYLNYFSVPDPDNGELGTADNTVSVVGSHEPFFLNDGSKAYLYAVRDPDTGVVGFRVLMQTDDGQVAMTLADAGFEIPQLEDTINFSPATTYVKYLQIDNKIFALSNAGESMRMFFVGSQKLVKRLYSIERPDWNVTDKLIVVHPDAAWINNGEPTSTRTNRAKNPDFEKDLEGWEAANDFTSMVRSDTQASNGVWSMRVSSKPERTNRMTQPLHDVATTGIDGWTEGHDTVVSADGSWLRIRVNEGADDRSGFGQSAKVSVDGNATYKFGFDFGNKDQIQNVGVMVRYFNGAGNQIGSDDYVDKSMPVTTGRRVSKQFTTPNNCATVRVAIVGYRNASNGVAYFQVKNVCLGLWSEGPPDALDGEAGANYFWTGTVNDSRSVYHPPQTVAVKYELEAVPDNWAASAYTRAESQVRSCSLDLKPLSTTGAVITTDNGTAGNNSTSAWTRVSNTTSAPNNTASLRIIVSIASVARDEFHYIDDVLVERSNSINTFFTGGDGNSSLIKYEWNGDPHASWSFEHTYAATTDRPVAETKTTDTLISSDRTENTHSFGFFYTLSNDIGESAVSQVTVVRAQRAWSAWVWEEPNGSGEPSGTPTSDPLLCTDQLVAMLPLDMIEEAKAKGALKWSLYMFTWADDEPMPVTALKITEREINDASDEETDSWLRVTPMQAEVSSDQALVPSLNTRFNSSDPSSGGQGIVAADRMVMVFDPNDQAVIKWSSNQQGSYFDFSPSKGGGYKTLTSGNLMIPACVKLWQNPQSVDTLTILCLGTDGMSTGYYMAPGQVASQSEATNFMAFEETTATPGTVSPYGCEVLNNALYHPLDEHLMKSNAANYNINHMTLTDMIQDKWRGLFNKQWIVSSQLDNRLYFLVHNPEGEPLEDGCWGNEVWVLDAAQKQGTWSRWLTQGQSLRKIEQGGQVFMSLVHPTGIYYFDEDASTDDYVDDVGDVQSRSIPWRMESNTQGANRAHDAWAHLQQLNVYVGNFQGSLRYGVRGLDVHGQPVDISKVVSDNLAPSVDAFDREDYLLIRKVMKEWFFYAESITDDLGEVQHSFGQLSLVQYRYAPISVNVGYEYGSVETFEYGASLTGASTTTDSGVPKPYIDVGRP